MKWIKEDKLPDPVPPYVITKMPNGKVFAYNTKHNLKGLKEIMKIHPNILLLDETPEEWISVEEFKKWVHDQGQYLNDTISIKKILDKLESSAPSIKDEKENDNRNG